MQTPPLSVWSHHCGTLGRDLGRIFMQKLISYHICMFLLIPSRPRLNLGITLSPIEVKSEGWQVLLLFFPFIFISWRLITLQYYSGFCHTLTWISHGVTCIPHPDPLSHLPLHPIPLGHPNAPAPSTGLMPTWAGDLFHPRQYTCFDAVLSKHPTLAFSPQSPKVCSVHLCLFFCFAYRVIVTIFLNSIYMC